MELDMPTQPHSALKDHLQAIDKQKEIDLYCELLSSGHSDGEILDSLDHLQSKSEHRDVTTVEHPSSRDDRVVADVTSEGELIGLAPRNTHGIPGLAALVRSESGRTEERQATEGKPISVPGPR